MKGVLKYFFNCFWLTLPFFLAIFVCAMGCASSVRHPDPLAGWKMSWSQDPYKLNQEIRDDYQTYIQKLPAKEKKFVGGIHLLENEIGQHAVAIEVDLYGPFGGTKWTHLLIYNTADRRIKTIKYISGHFLS